jgi:hypothetical protein
MLVVTLVAHAYNFRVAANTQSGSAIMLEYGRSRERVFITSRAEPSGGVIHNLPSQPALPGRNSRQQRQSAGLFLTGDERETILPNRTN